MSPAAWATVEFGAGPYRCLLDARQVQSMQAAGRQSQPLEHWLGLAAPAAERRRCLRLSGPDGPLLVEVSEPVGLLEVDPRSLHPLPELIRLGCALPALRALQWEGGIWRLVLSSRQLLAAAGLNSMPA
jgi:hypothetical protein